MIHTEANDTYAPKMSIANAAAFLDISVQGVHRKLKNKNLTCPKIGNKSCINYDIAKNLFELAFNKRDGSKTGYFSEHWACGSATEYVTI